MSLNLIMIFAMTAFIASIIPGPSMLLALTHGMNHGVRKTVATAMGNVTVTLIQAAISVTGLGTILIASENVFQVIKWIGAGYLIYMGLSVFFSSKKSFDPGEMSKTVKSTSLKKMFMQGAIITAGNPKAIIFFTAIFPQFINHNGAYFTQCSILMSVCAVAAFSCFMIYAIGGQKIVSVFSTAKAGKYIKRVIGGTFIGAGIGLVLSRR